MFKLRWAYQEYKVTAVDIAANRGEESLQDCKKRLLATTPKVLQYFDDDRGYWITVPAICEQKDRKTGLITEIEQ